jgi:hypothetical protein
MENEIILGEHHVHQNNGGLTVQIVALVDKHTKYFDGVPIDGFVTLIKFKYSMLGLQETNAVVTLNELNDIFEFANALAGAGYKLREALAKTEKGRQ